MLPVSEFSLFYAQNIFEISRYNTESLSGRRPQVERTRFQK